MRTTHFVSDWDDRLTQCGLEAIDCSISTHLHEVDCTACLFGCEEREGVGVLPDVDGADIDFREMFGDGFGELFEDQQTRLRHDREGAGSDYSLGFDSWRE